ncbi:DUF3846 domain-containing protein [Streptomyces virginiae]|uniref:DUF3846 domain-containing protein n=1 Tax=Streptomyces virginiae TaxID=1961 RepID=UPI002F90ABC0
MPTLLQDSYALRVEPTGGFRLLDWGSEMRPQDALDADQVRCVDVTTRLIMWTDELAVPLGLASNVPARSLLRAFQSAPAPVCGAAVFTGSTFNGALLGLTEDQALALLDRYFHRPGAIPGPRG